MTMTMAGFQQGMTASERRRLKAGLLKPELDYLNGQIADLTAHRDDLAEEIAWLQEVTPPSASVRMRLSSLSRTESS